MASNLKDILDDLTKKLIQNFSKQLLWRSKKFNEQFDDDAPPSNELECIRKFGREVRALRQDQEHVLEGVQNLWNKIEEDQEQEVRELRLQIYSYCCVNPFGLLDPVIGSSITSLEWYKIFQGRMFEFNNSLNEFLGKEREEINIGKILPSKLFLILFRFYEYYKGNIIMLLKNLSAQIFGH